jgi:hypothetical protein
MSIDFSVESESKEEEEEEEEERKKEDHLKYLFNLRWHFLCMFNRISLKSNAFDTICRLYCGQICEEIFTDEFNSQVNNKFTEIANFYYSLLEETLFLQSYHRANNEEGSEISPNLKDIFKDSSFYWKDKKYSFCSLDLILEFFDNLSNEKVSNFYNYFFEIFSNCF